MFMNVITLTSKFKNNIKNDNENHYLKVEILQIFYQF
jgi:hypothetical protein